MAKLPPKKKKGKFKTFSKETKAKILYKWGYRCACQCSNKCDGSVHSIHHLVENTTANRKKYGDRIQSEENGVPLSQYCHSNCVTFFKYMKVALLNKWDAELASEKGK